MMFEYLPRRSRAAALITTALVCGGVASAANQKPLQADLLAQNTSVFPESGLQNPPEKAGVAPESSAARNPGIDLLTQQPSAATADERPANTAGGGYFSLAPFHNFWIASGLVISLISLAFAGWALMLARKNGSRISNTKRRLETAVSDSDDFNESRGTQHRKDIELLRLDINALKLRTSALTNQQTPSHTPSRQQAAPHATQKKSAERPAPKELQQTSLLVAAYTLPPPAPEVFEVSSLRHEFSAAALNAEVLSCIEQLARAGTQITQANAAVRILGSCHSDELKQGLQMANLNVSFYTAAGDASAINAELLAWSLSGQQTFQVVPHPHAGRVGQFNKWFDLGNGEYFTQPVLASRPATAQLINQKLVPATLGALR